MPRPSVKLRCVADTYTNKTRERIIEFHHVNGGGLISFFALDDGRLDVHVYGYDKTVDVRVGKPRE